MNINADFWIDYLQLQPHPEGGYYREVYRSPETIHADTLPDRYASKRNMSTSIYFLLKSGQVSAFHRLKSDEIWHFYYGSSLSVYIIDKNGRLREEFLGCDAGNNIQLQLVIPNGYWFAAKVNQPDTFSLIGCTVSPGFDFHDFELAKKSNLLEDFPQHKEIINKMCVK